MSELDRIVERIRQTRAAHVATTADRIAAAAPAAGQTGATHAIGARVFDLQTGLEGTVEGGARENVVIPTSKR